jgi:hypothetical protein
MVLIFLGYLEPLTLMFEVRGSGSGRTQHYYLSVRTSNIEPRTSNPETSNPEPRTTYSLTFDLMQTASKKVINGWAMYDWSNSVYNLVILPLLFSRFIILQ